MHEKKLTSSVDEALLKEMAKINWGAWYYIFGTSGKKKWSKI